MAIRRRASHALAYIRQHGLVGTARYAAQRIPEVYYEWCFGITTAGRIELEDLGVTNPFACHYYPTDYPSIFATFRRLPIRPLEDVFLDYGCGKGRVLVVCSTRFGCVMDCVPIKLLLLSYSRCPSGNGAAG